MNEIVPASLQSHDHAHADVGLAARRWAAIAAGIAVLSFCVTTTYRSATAAEESWPEFRGPGQQGHSVTARVPTLWSEQQNIAWKVATPGRGWSSPVIVGQRIWMTTAIESELPPEEVRRRVNAQLGSRDELTISGPVSLRLICLDRRDGRQLYDVELFHIAEPDPLHPVNSYASPTTVYDQGRLYCHFGTYGTACVEPETGHAVWTRRLPLKHIVGPGSSPIVFEDLLVIPCDGGDAQYVVALNKQTGETVWKTDRPDIDDKHPDQRKSFCTPLLIDAAGRKQLIVPGPQWCVAYDPRSGEQLWRVNHGSGFSIAPRPVYGDGLVYFTTGYQKASLLAVRVDGHGDVTATHVVWRTDKQISMKPSPLLFGGLLYIISDNGIATCFDARSGQVHWTKRIPGRYSASPLEVGGLIYFFSQQGTTTVIKPGQSYEQVSANTLDEGCMASAAALDGALYLRSERHVYRIEDGSAGKR